MDLINQDQNTLNNAATNAFMLLAVTVRFYTGTTKLVDAAKRAEEQAGAEDTGARMYINALGAHHNELKYVIGKYQKVRTYLYLATLAFSQAEEGQQKRGKRLACVTRVPEILNQLAVLKVEAVDALNDLLPNWDHLCNIAASRAGMFRDEMKFPTAEEVRQKFSIQISVPECIEPVDMSRFGSLPTALANEIAEARNSQLAAQLEGAKTEAMNAAKAHMDIVAKQLTDGKRLSETLVSLSTLHSQTLRDMVTGYDNDPRIIAMADRIDTEIANCTTEVWKDSAYARYKSRDAARVISKGLSAMTKPVTPSQVQATNQSLAGGLLADLLD
tara:strand:+ start:132 stop:1121 length:990 start_codon:yes stop_codon:yes gene_type:complete